MTAPTTSSRHPEALQLTGPQQQSILHAVTMMVRETTLGQPLSPLPPEVAELVVSGTFVCLKRNKHLRGCCGGLQGEPMTLGRILQEAVNRTVMDDPRFPPVSPSELPYLDAEIWLLFNPKSVEAKGRNRIGAVVTGGKHGLVVRWGEQRGLLLPGVAAEHGWDSETFLEHVCSKAGLHASRWQEDDTFLLTFEGIAVRGPVGSEGPTDFRFLSEEQVRAYTEFCRESLAMHLIGGTPRYSPPGLPDGTISGLVLSLDLGSGQSPLQASRIDLRHGLALHASLYQLTQAFAPVLIQAEVSEYDLDRLTLAILYDPTIHGGLDDPDLRGIDPKRRALLVMERGRSSLVYSATTDAETSLREAASLLPVKDEQAAALFSFAADVSHTRVAHSVAPRPWPGPTVRPPAVAGKFYPAPADALRAMVDKLLGPERTNEKWPAAMVPHAGLPYSGKIAATVFRRLAIPSTVIILSPKHTPFGMDWAVAPHQHWAIPGGRIASDPGLAQQLVDAIPGLSLDAAAHQQEHGIEVELPFIMRLAPNARVVGVALSGATLEECREFAAGLAKVVRSQAEPPLLLISSDMNHFASHAATRRLDEMALECMDRLDAEGLYETCRRRHISMCGMVPAVIVMETLRALGKLTRAERAGYTTTASTTGDPGRVVGYAGMVLG